jgi:hypothetical protein
VIIFGTRNNRLYVSLSLTGFLYFSLAWAECQLQLHYV